jgi:hypothetical protein
MANTITLLKKDAIITLQVGTGFLQKLQGTLTGLASERTPEEMKAFQEMLEKGETDFPEDWMDHMFVISTLVHGLEKEAINQGHTYEADVDSVISTSES